MDQDNQVKIIKDSILKAADGAFGTKQIKKIPTFLPKLIRNNVRKLQSMGSIIQSSTSKPKDYEEYSKLKKLVKSQVQEYKHTKKEKVKWQLLNDNPTSREFWKTVNRKIKNLAMQQVSEMSLG